MKLFAILIIFGGLIVSFLLFNSLVKQCVSFVEYGDFPNMVIFHSLIDEISCPSNQFDGGVSTFN